MDQIRAKMQHFSPAVVCPGRLLGFGDLQEFGRICQGIQHSCTPSGAPDLRRPRGESPAPHPLCNEPLCLLSAIFWGCLCSPLKRPTCFSHGVSSVESMEEANTLHAYVCRMMMTTIGKLVPSCDKLGSKLGPCWGKLEQPRWDHIGPS